MVFMDTCTFGMLPGPPPSAFFSGCGHRRTAEFDDAYLRAIRELPPAPFASTPVHHAATLHGSIELPATCELYAAALHGSIELPATCELYAAALHDSIGLPATCELYAAALNSHLLHPSVQATVSEPRLSDYDADIDHNLRKMENNIKQRPSPDYLNTLLRDPKSQSTRAHVISWMGDVTHHFHLAAGTLQRAVSYVDRVLSEPERTLWLTHTEMEYGLHLLGATAVYTAAKYEERCTRSKVNAAGIAGFCRFDSSKDVIDMELLMVAALQYDLSGPTAYTFVHRFTMHTNKGGGEQDHMEVQRLAHHFAEQSILDHRWVRHPPSALAASALFLARLILNPTANQVRQWNADFEELTGYKPTDLTLEIMTMRWMNPHDPRFDVLSAFLQDE